MIKNVKMNDQSVKLKRKNLIRTKKLKGSLRKLFLALTVLLLFLRKEIITWVIRLVEVPLSAANYRQARELTG